MGWRKFLVYLRNLPPGSAFIYKLKEDEEWNSGRAWRHALDEAMGLEPGEYRRSSLGLSDLARGANLA